MHNPGLMYPGAMLNPLLAGFGQPLSLGQLQSPGNLALTYPHGKSSQVAESVKSSILIATITCKIDTQAPLVMNHPFQHIPTHSLDILR